MINKLKNYLAETSPEQKSADWQAVKDMGLKGVSAKDFQNNLKVQRKQLLRKEALMPNGVPRYVRCYDNGGETADRYTVCFTGRYTHKTNGGFWYVGMSSEPFHPQGFGQHGDSLKPIDRPAYSHLGKRIKFESLPDDCKKLVLNTYCDLWDIQ